MCASGELACAESRYPDSQIAVRVGDDKRCIATFGRTGAPPRAVARRNELGAPANAVAVDTMR